MSTPKGMKCLSRTLASGERVLLYSNASLIVLQVRRQVPTEEDLLSSSFKVAIALTPMEAAQLAGDLLSVALAQLQTCERGEMPSSAEQSEERQSLAE